MLEFEKGNLITGDYPIFCQQVNCKGIMGSGIARQIREACPWVYVDYKRLCDANNHLLGHIQLSHEPGLNGRICVNMFAQDNYGRNKCYTDYYAFQYCLDVLAKEIAVWSPKRWHTIGFPDHIGCGLAGGDWNVILPMLEKFSDKVKHRVVVVRLEE